MKSDAKKTDTGTKKKFTLRQKVIVALGAVLCLVVIVFASAYGVFLHYYNKMNISSLNDNDEIVTAIDYEEDEINEKDLSEEERAQLDQFFEDANSTEDNKSDDAAIEIIKENNSDVTNILLLGIDSRKRNVTRSRTDTMVILSIDKKNKKLVMTSVLRDTYVTIPGVGRNRLNAANIFGGQKLLFKTFEENFDIHLEKYVQIDFYNFIKLVDAVG